ncbi:MAG: hypothetical protein Kow0092_27420 [Deferrisomatales bacterium]
MPGSWTSNAVERDAGTARGPADVPRFHPENAVSRMERLAAGLRPRHPKILANGQPPSVSVRNHSFPDGHS